MNIFLNKHYELAMVIVGLDPDSDDFEDDKKVADLLYLKFSIDDIEGFEKLIDALKPIIDASLPPFDDYIPPKRTKNEYDDNSFVPYVLSDN